VKRKINSEICNLPGLTGTGPIDPTRRYNVMAELFGFNIGSKRVTISGGGWVTSQLGNGGLRVTNRTTALHPFAGTVTRDYFRAGNGSWYVATRGVGTSVFGFIDRTNQRMGSGIFRRVNAQCRAHVQSGG
jgi:hypothetical protein